MSARRRLPLAAAAALLLPLAACTPAVTEAAGDWPGYDSWEGVLAASDLVVVADVVSEHESTLYADDHPGDESYALPVTITTVEVLEVVQGDARAGEQLEVSLPGTRLQQAAGVRHLADIDAEALLLALVAFDGSPYSPVNPAQGVLAVDADGAVRPADDDPGFDLPRVAPLAG